MDKVPDLDPDLTESDNESDDPVPITQTNAVVNVDTKTVDTKQAPVTMIDAVSPLVLPMPMASARQSTEAPLSTEGRPFHGAPVPPSDPTLIRRVNPPRQCKSSNQK